MSSFPEKGMYFEQARSRLLRYKTAVTNQNMRQSLINQVRVAEGEKAAAVLEDEFIRKRMIGDKKVNDGLNCSGSSQFGSGGFKSCSNDKSFKKVGPGRYTKVY